MQDFKKHLIFYRVLGDRVEIIRVLHATRDVEGILESNEQNRI